MVQHWCSYLSGALQCVHPRTRERSQSSMHRERCFAKPTEEQQDPIACYSAGSGQIRRRCSGVEEDFSGDVFKFVCSRNALSAKGCAVGGLAGEILARPAFTLSGTKTFIELFAVSAAELGFETATASLGQIYTRARQLGFELAAAEIAPQLRLQYLDQPIGEFLIIGMEPINTWQGEPVILTVANGGAGLILIGQGGRLDAQMSITSRFLFVQANKAAPAEAALVDR